MTEMIKLPVQIHKEVCDAKLRCNGRNFRNKMITNLDNMSATVEHVPKPDLQRHFRHI